MRLDMVLFWLVALSLGTTLLTYGWGEGGGWFVAAVMVLSALKARLILNHYLGLSQAPAWKRGFGSFITLFTSVVLASYFLPTVV